MFGEFSVSYNGRFVNEHTRRSVKAWLILEYMIVFRGRDLPQEELIELLWGKGKDASFGALKTQIHRLRAELDKLLYPGEIIVNTHGSYALNRHIDCVIDADEFENICKKAFDSKDDDERLLLAKQATTIYRGGYLPHFSNETWVVPSNSYYKSLYEKIMVVGIDAASKLGLPLEVALLCEKALDIDPLNIDFHKTLLATYSNRGNLDKVTSHYHFIEEIFASKRGTLPPEDIRLLYGALSSESKTEAADFSTVMRTLNDDATSGAYCCSLDVFKSIVRVEQRQLKRSKRKVSLFLLTLTDLYGQQPDKLILRKAMERFSEVIRCSLRISDSFSMYSTSQYIVMLHDVSSENCAPILERLRKRYSIATVRGAEIFRYDLHVLPNADDIS